MTFPFPTFDAAVAGAVAFPTIASLQHRYVASLGVTGDPVTAWADQQGSADLSSVGAPDFVATGAGSQPYILFDGTDDQLSVTGLTINQPYHAFIVLAQPTWTANDYMISFNSSGFSFIRQKQSAGTQYDTEHGANTPSGNVVDPGDTNFHLISSFFNGASSYQEIDGGSKSGPSNIGSGAVNGISVGGSFGSDFANCQVAELCLFNAEVTSTDLANLEAYFASAYGLTIS